MIDIRINGQKYTNYLQTGFSYVELFDEELDYGTLLLREVPHETPFKFLSLVKLKMHGISKSFFIMSDDPSIVSKNPLIYDHELQLIELTKLLELHNVNGFKYSIDLNGATKTLYDLVKKLRDIYPLRHTSEFANNEPLTKLIFNIPEETKTLLEQYTAPEINIKDDTLRSALDKIVSVIDGNVYLDENSDLRINLFGDRNTEKTLDFVDKTLKMSNEENVTNIISNAFNPSTRGNPNTFEIYPAKDMYTTSRTDEILWDFGAGINYFPTHNKIEKVNKINFRLLLEIQTDGVPLPQENTVDMSVSVENEVVETNKALALPYAQNFNELIENPNTLYRNGVLTYDYGGKKVNIPFYDRILLTDQSSLGVIISKRLKEILETDGMIFNYLPPEVTVILGWDISSAGGSVSVRAEFDDGAGRIASITFVADTLTFGQSNNKMLANIEYDSIPETIRVNIEKDDLSESNVKTFLIGNQESRIVDVGKYLDNNKFRVNRLGKNELTIQQVYEEFDNIMQLKDFIVIDNNIYVVTKKETIVYQDFLDIRYELHRDFNKHNKFVGVDSEVRQWDINESGRTLERHVNYDEYVEISYVDDGTTPLGDYNSLTLTERGKDKILATLDTGVVDNKPIGQAFMRSLVPVEIDGITVNKPLLNLPLSKYAGGGQVIFYLNIDDNASIGRLINNLDLGRKEQLPVLYTDYNGKIDDFILSLNSLNSDIKTINELLEEGDSLPATTQRDELALRDVEGSFRLLKDSGEKIGFGLSYHFVPKERNIIIGSLFSTNNLLIKESTNELYIKTYNTLIKPRDKDNVSNYISELNTTKAYNGVVNYNNNYIDVTFDSNDENAVSWCIVDGNDNLYLAVNKQPKTGRIRVDFHTQRQDIVYNPIFSFGGTEIESNIDLSSGVNYIEIINGITPHSNETIIEINTTPNYIVLVSGLAIYSKPREYIDITTTPNIDILKVSLTTYEGKTNINFTTTPDIQSGSVGFTPKNVGTIISLGSTRGINIVIVEEEPQVEICAIFDTQGGTSIGNICTFNSSLYVNIPPEPTRTGYDFLGWTPSLPRRIYNTTTFTASWVAKAYTVTFEDYDGTVLKTQAVNYGENATPPIDPTRSCHTFSGWIGSYTNITQNTTITAGYSIIFYTVAFEYTVSTSQSNIATRTVNCGTLINQINYPTPPALSGYVFTGWTILPTSTVPVTSNLTIEALYDPLPATSWQTTSNTNHIDTFTYNVINCPLSLDVNNWVDNNILPSNYQIGDIIRVTVFNTNTLTICGTHYYEAV